MRAARQAWAVAIALVLQARSGWAGFWPDGKVSSDTTRLAYQVGAANLQLHNLTSSTAQGSMDFK